MADELAWRKFPRNAPRNVELDYIAELAVMKYPDKPYIAMAPLQFYTIAYCMADDDGVIDIDDGIIYSRMMQKVIAPDEIIFIAELMAKRKILIHVCDGVYFIADWEAPQRKENFPRKAQTAEERRAAVAEKIRSEHAKRNASSDNSVTVDFDKIAKNVATESFFCNLNDKNAKSVATYREREKERETDETREIEKEETDRREIDEIERRETHTERGTLPLVSNSFSVQEAESQRQEESKTGRTEDRSTMTNSLAKMALQEESSQSQVEQAVERSTATKQVQEQLNQFFTKKNIGYTAQGRETHIAELANRIMAVASKENPPNMVANIICGQFEKLTQTEGYYFGIALLPENLLKRGPYATVLQAVSKILANKGNYETWEHEIEKYMQQSTQIHDEVDGWMAEEFRKYGIDPNDPQRQAELMRAKAAEKNAGR